MSKEAIKKTRLWHFYFMEGIIVSAWIGYIFKFYSFYKEAYFYTDKRLSIFLRMLSFLNNNWSEIVIYFILSFLLMSITLFLTYLLYIIANKNEKRHNKIILISMFVNFLSCLSLLINICGFIFGTIFILAASLVYIIFILANVGSSKGAFHYEEGELVDTKGPFETEEEAHKEMTLFFNQWQQNKIILDEEIYIESDNKYYVDFYVEEIKK
jgi:hypothetical protein